MKPYNSFNKVAIKRRRSSRGSRSSHIFPTHDERTNSRGRGSGNFRGPGSESANRVHGKTPQGRPKMAANTTRVRTSARQEDGGRAQRPRLSSNYSRVVTRNEKRKNQKRNSHLMKIHQDRNKVWLTSSEQTRTKTLDYDAT